MLQIADAVTNKLAGLLRSKNGVPAALTALLSEEEFTLPPVTPQQIICQNVAPELSERSAGSKYPIICVYCSKLANELREKFRSFSGDAQMVIEARVSQDRLDELEMHLHAYADAITQVLDDNRGDWGDGVFYAGGYEVSFGSVKPGGRNFIQIAKVTLDLEISAD